MNVIRTKSALSFCQSLSSLCQSQSPSALNCCTITGAAGSLSVPYTDTRRILSLFYDLHHDINPICNQPNQSKSLHKESYIYLEFDLWFLESKGHHQLALFLVYPPV